MTKTRFVHFKKPTSVSSKLREAKNKNPQVFEKKGIGSLLKLFKFTYQNVPAYRDFLKDRGITSITDFSLEKFSTLPITDKKTYLRKYDYPTLFPHGDISSATTISATSGSTGEPFYFPRSEQEDAHYEFLAHVFLRNQFDIDNKKTLVIVGFGMGIWIGGIFTYKNFNKIAQTEQNLTLAPVGPNIALFLETLKHLGGYFDQVILAGYPPFIKDVIDEAHEHGVSLKKYHIRILTAAEEFSEKFRDYIGKKAGIRNIFTDIINIYGTVEMGTMAHETALTTLVRKLSLTNPRLFRALFPHAHRMPTLAQYNPEIIYFEKIGSEVIASGYGSSIPLIRYRFPDMGGVLKYTEVIEIFKSFDIDLLQEAKKVGVDEKIIRWPFVYVYGRKDHAVILRGANIHPDEIRLALHHDLVEDTVTGKVVLEKKESASLDEMLVIHVELQKGKASSAELESIVQKVIVDHLLLHNSEYSDQYKSVPDAVTPKIVFHEYHDSQYFKPGKKHRWTIK